MMMSQVRDNGNGKVYGRTMYGIRGAHRPAGQCQGRPRWQKTAGEPVIVHVHRPRY